MHQLAVYNNFKTIFAPSSLCGLRTSLTLPSSLLFLGHSSRVLLVCCRCVTKTLVCACMPAQLPAQVKAEEQGRDVKDEDDADADADDYGAEDDDAGGDDDEDAQRKPPRAGALAACRMVPPAHAHGWLALATPPMRTDGIAIYGYAATGHSPPLARHMLA